MARLFFVGLLLLGCVSIAAAAPDASNNTPAQVKVVKAPAASSVKNAPRLGARTAEQREIETIQAEGRRKVAALAKSLVGLPDGPQAREIQGRIERVKAETEVQTLAAIAQHARARGDGATAREADRQIELRLHPPKPVVGSEAASPVKSAQPPAVPAEKRKAAQKGGRP